MPAMPFLRLLSLCAVGIQSVNADAEYTCILEPIADYNATGTVTFTQADGSPFVRVEATVTNLPDGAECYVGSTPGRHGIHIHEFGILDRESGSNAGPHYNPQNEQHGCYDPLNPMNADRKAGDLGNLENGEFVAEEDYLISLNGFGPQSIVARSVVVHLCEDNCERSDEGDASAGARVAQCIIGVVQPSAVDPTEAPTFAPTMADPESDSGESLAIGEGTAVAIAFCSSIFGALCVYAAMHGQKGLNDPFQDSEGVGSGDQAFIEQKD